jgi:transcriptional repressor NrdR
MSEAVACPTCNGASSVVVETRRTKVLGPPSIRRRRECQSCGKRFTTLEIPVARIEVAAAVWATKADRWWAQ